MYILMCFAGIFIVGIAVWRYARTELNTDMMETTGELIEYIEEISGSGIFKKRVYSLYIAYTVNNITYTIVSKRTTSRKKWHIGKQFKVFYKLDNPSVYIVVYYKPIYYIIISLIIFTAECIILKLIGIK